MPKDTYFEWLAKVCALLGKPKSWGATIVEDVNWFAAWDDGLTPEEAVKQCAAATVTPMPPQ